uniref:Uncharacterized protein LOC114340971 n=1 Tax=Diabrotica virgifera virgifera TaxID=50390 RepID=A0A6P7GDM1_DIAVI
MFKRLRNNPESQELKTEYNRYRNSTNTLIKEAKENYYKRQINKNKNNPKELWTTINKLCNTKKSNTINTMINADGDVVIEAKQIANLFNNTFVDVGRNLASKINANRPNPVKEEKLNTSMFLRPTNAEEIITIIGQLKNGKTPGIDHKIYNPTKQPATTHRVENNESKALDSLVSQCSEQVGQPEWWNSVMKRSAARN